MLTNTNAPESPAIGAVHEVRGSFRSSAEMQQAIERLQTGGFDRADLSVPEVAPPPERATPESGALEADTEEDARQARTMHTSTAATVAALAGAGLAIATGGAAVPALAAAVLAGSAAGGATYAISSAANDEEQAELDARAAAGRLVLSVRAASADKRSHAAQILRECGAVEVLGG